VRNVLAHSCVIHGLAPAGWVVFGVCRLRMCRIAAQRSCGASNPA
jgi:hypothetical protein